MSSAKPIVGITGDFRPERYNGQALSWFNTGYYDSVIGAGGIPFLLPPYDNDADLKQAMEQLGGLVLAGSTLDLDPVRMGLHPSPAVRVMPKRREDFDRRIAKLAIEMKLPILAIGSGMQLVNVLCGGTLFQDIPEDCPRALHHRDEGEKNLRHVLEIVPGTRLDDIYGPGEVRVNSHHHMAVNELARPFRVCATCPDGIIEAYESVSDDWYCMGVQWHPESSTASALDIQVFESFIGAAGHRQNVEVIPMSSVMRRAAA
ncbi:MAG: gamma-glutamyl-gamma-aminobutyrate hydrolase family protein [Planctomycetaceae bacterium]|nr:gamma-glutamyl-gamma-aminobutyrate hydrolase family protein [Planctomycetaceae bacterium]